MRPATSPAATPFQYPLSDRTHCNWPEAQPRQPHQMSFSILYRIEPTVTTITNVLNGDRNPFQYPLSDRTHCNWYYAMLEGSVEVTFQYPLSDRTHCNRRGIVSSSAGNTSFSILYRIEPTVTESSGVAHSAGGGLSVSSIGSNPL